MSTSCPDCGPVPVPHAIHWFGSGLEYLMAPWWRWTNRVSARMGSWAPFPWARFLKLILPALKAVGLVRTADAPDSRHSLRTRVMWEEGAKRGVRLTEIRPFGRGIDAFLAEKEGRVFGFEGLPRPEGYHRALEWMDDKVEMRQRFQDAGIPIASGGVAGSVREALKIFSRIGGTVIVKPRIGSRSRHTHMGIRTEEELLRAFSSARRLCPSVVVERELQGAVHRVTLVGGRVVAVARRDLPHVVGDGVRTVAELIRIKNCEPQRTRGDVFHPIEITDETHALLAGRKMTLSSVPATGERVNVGVKVNRGIGGEVVELTPQVHEENRDLFARIGAVVGDPLVGVDLIMTAVDVPWHAQECGVIECNSLPFIELHHFPYQGEPVNVAGAVWDTAIAAFSSEI